MTQTTKPETLQEYKDHTCELMRLLIECRDALPALSVVQIKLHNISPTLCDRIDACLKPWEVHDGSGI